MPWSTSELAGLSGTTVNTIRHYHRLGLLSEPHRTGNGYKQYGVPDLVRLLRIRRLTDLGVPLSHIGAAGLDAESTPDTLRQLDAQIAIDVERLQRTRVRIAAILAGNVPADTPPGFESVAGIMSQADSALIQIYTQHYDDEALADLKRMVENDAHYPVTGELDSLPPEADEATRQDVAERLAIVLERNLVEYPWLREPGAHLSTRKHLTQQTFVEALVELYNPAQLDVLGRASILATRRLQEHHPDQAGSAADAS